MIRTFRNKQLANLWAGKRAKVPADLVKRVMVRLEALDAAAHPGDMARPGFEFHPLPPTTRFAVSVSGPWRITFDFENGDALLVDLEQYH